MQKIPKPEYTTEFKEQAVKRVKDGKTVGAVAKEMGLVEQTLRNWVKASDAGRLDGPGARKVMPEEMELSRLRAEVVRLKREVDILKKATAYFARDALFSLPGLTRSARCSTWSRCVRCWRSASAVIAPGNAVASRNADGSRIPK